MTQIYIFEANGSVRTMELKQNAENIARAINQGDWQTYFGYEPQPTQSWQAMAVGKNVIVTHPEEVGDFPIPKVTARELQLLQLFCAGLTNNQIAYKLHLDSRTIRGYTTRLRAKLRARTTIQLLAIATSLGLVRPDLEKLLD